MGQAGLSGRQASVRCGLHSFSPFSRDITAVPRLVTGYEKKICSFSPSPSTAYV